MKKSMKKGFTLIELMIVIAIISIIAAIAIPNLMQSRIRANESTAVTAIKNYATAQVTFQVGRQGRLSVNTANEKGYAINYRNLFHGAPVGGAANAANLALISQAHANAYAAEPTGQAVNPSSKAGLPGSASPYQGYYFANPTGALITDDFFTLNFAQVACPANTDTTGNNHYWVGTEGTVYMKGSTPGKTTPTDSYGDIGASNPSQQGDYSGWMSL